MFKKSLISLFCIVFNFIIFVLPVFSEEADNEFEEVGTAGTSGDNKYALVQFSLT